LTNGDEFDDPTDENRRAVVVVLAELKIEIPEPVNPATAERRIGSRQKDPPTRP
jgi:hypothetical protein